MKKLLIGVLLSLSLVGCSSKEVTKVDNHVEDVKVESVQEDVQEVNYEKKPGVEYTVENLEKFLDYEFLEILADLGPCETEGRKDTYRQTIEYIDISLNENKGKISEPLLEYANEYREACVDLMNAKDYIDIRGIMTELEYRALDYEYTK